MAKVRLSEELLGRGLALQLHPDAETRALPWVTGTAAVRQAIEIILMTRRGERLMRPDFGSGLARYLMEPNNPTTRELIRRDVEQSISQWEPRVVLKSVKAESSVDDPSLVVVTIEYTHRIDRSSETAVFSFSTPSSALALEAKVR